MGRFVAMGPPCTLTPTSSATQAILFDRKRTNCYLVGPTLLTGAAVSKATVRYDSQVEEWVVNLHWSNDDFLRKVANARMINREIAIVVNGVVLSAPVVNAGITGREIEIVGGFSKAEAVKVAASVMGIAPSAVTVEPRVD